VIKKGEAISCCMCHKEIFRAREDIPFGAQMKSTLLEFMDGEPVPYGSEMVCPNCWVEFWSISTVTKQTTVT
jgi:hypothetical protein